MKRSSRTGANADRCSQDLGAWKTSGEGNRHIDHHILVVKRSGGFGLKIGARWGILTFISKRDAMLRAFDVVIKRVSS